MDSVSVTRGIDYYSLSTITNSIIARENVDKVSIAVVFPPVRVGSCSPYLFNEPITTVMITAKAMSASAPANSAEESRASLAKANPAIERVMAVRCHDNKVRSCGIPTSSGMFASPMSYKNAIAAMTATAKTAPERRISAGELGNGIF